MLTAYDITGEEYHHTREDVDILHQLAHSLPDSPVIVNIGACFGTSALALIENRLDAVLFSIDVQVCSQERDNLAMAGIPPSRVIRILGRSQEVGVLWPCKVDLVFVDGAHDRESIFDDILWWWPQLKPGGIMAFHDYGTPSLPHVKATVDDIMTGEFELLHIGTIKAFRK